MPRRVAPTLRRVAREFRWLFRPVRKNSEMFCGVAHERQKGEKNEHRASTRENRGGESPESKDVCNY